jgi:hypothetical protein
VRRGNKWSGYHGDVIMKTPAIGAFTVCKSPIIGRIVYTKEVKFMDIRAIDIDIEHDPECRTYSGLLNAMKLVYGEDFDPLETVTVIYFMIIEEKQDE